MDKERLVRMLGDVFTNCTALSEEVLARYAELEIAGQEPDKQLPEVGEHLHECSDCAGRYAELLALLQAEEGGSVPPALSRYTFDLQFLSAPEPGLWVEVKETVRRLATEIPIVIQQAATAFGPLPPALVPCRVMVAAREAHGVLDMTTGIESLRIPDESANLVFILTPGPVDANEKGITLIFEVQDLQDGEPLGQVRVSLRDAQAQLLQSKTTTSDGRVIFRGLVGDYIVRCQHAGRVWEFPVKLKQTLSS
jgi:hypothetical protein